MSDSPHYCHSCSHFDPLPFSNSSGICSLFYSLFHLHYNPDPRYSLRSSFTIYLANSPHSFFTQADHGTDCQNFSPTPPPEPQC